MESLGHSLLPPTALGRQDDEEATSGTDKLVPHGMTQQRRNMCCVKKLEQDLSKKIRYTLPSQGLSKGYDPMR
ncbi:hypothetical protein TNCV_3661201 [Trichonephila clavipes]|nr:hypothetical protein TNCV_3661201 [Trichonephila clavipes]